MKYSTSASSFYGTYKTPGFLPNQKNLTSESTYYTNHRTPSYSQTPTARVSEANNQSSTPYKNSLFTSAAKLQDVKNRYEKEVQNVSKKYEEHYTTQFDLGNTVMELEDLVRAERNKVYNLEKRMEDALRGMEQLKRQTLDLERENRALREKARTNEVFIADCGQKINNVQQTASSVNFENDGLRSEIKQLNDTFNIKLRDLEEKYKLETNKYTDEIEQLKTLLKDKDIDHESKVRSVNRDLQSKLRALENQLREKDRIIVEYNAEFKYNKDFNAKLKMECEDELRNRISTIQDQERAKYEPNIKNLEAKIQDVTKQKELLEQKVPTLQQEIQMKENKAREVKNALDEQIRTLRKEILDLEDQVCTSRADLEKIEVEFRGKEQVINRALAEISNLNSENSRQKDIYIKEIDRLAARNETDQNRFQEFERQSRERIVEIERDLRASEAETLRVKSDFEKMMQKIAGNVNTTISQTFVAYGVQGADNVDFY